MLRAMAEALDLPAGPRLPGAVQTALWLTRSLRFLEDCRRRHGDMFTLRMAGFPPAVFACSPEAIRDIFAADGDTLCAGAARAPYFRPFFGDNALLTLDGAAHMARRRLMLPAFHGERMHAYGETMARAAERAIAEWPQGRPFALLPSFQRITQDVILESVFGISEPARVELFRARLMAFIQRGASPLLLIPGLQRDLGRLSPWGRVVRAGREVDGLIHDELAARRARPASEQGSDVLAMLLGARDEAGQPLDDQALRNELVTQLVAGHDTTAAALSWLMTHLIENPAALERAQAEALAAPASAEALAALPFLDAAMRESLRLQPIISNVGRWIRRPVTIAGRELPTKVSVSACIYLAHRDPASWPEPARFLPERFLPAGKKVDPYAWLPFGGGTRRCIGMAFAMYELKVVAATMLRSGHFTLPARSDKRPRLRSITYQPADRVTVVYRARDAGRSRAVPATNARVTL